MEEKNANREVVAFESSDGQARLEVTTDHDTVRLSQAPLIELFGRDKSVISRHVNNLFKEGELNKNSVVAKYATTAADGKTYQQSIKNK